MATFGEYNDAIFRFSLVKVTDRRLAEDMTQEVFMRYWRYLIEGKDISNLRAFLYTIANNLAKDWYKRKKSVPLEEDEDRGAALVSHDLSPEILAAYQEALAKIEGMEAGDREVLLLRYVEGLEPRDIAALYNESPNTISVRLNRAMGRLKQRLHV